MNGAPAWRRLAAFAVDYLLIAAWMGAIAGVSLALGRSGQPPESLAERVLGHLVADASLTGPVVLYFALTESLMGGGLGKRLFGVSIRRRDGTPVSLGRSLARSAFKFAPWELAHVGLWYGPGRPLFDAPSGFGLAALTAATGLAALWAAGLFAPSGRTVYDRLAGTRAVCRKSVLERSAT